MLRVLTQACDSPGMFYGDVGWTSELGGSGPRGGMPCGLPSCMVFLCHLLYFASGWCTTMATVERSGVIWPDGVSFIPILSGLSMSHTRRC